MFTENVVPDVMAPERWIVAVVMVPDIIYMVGSVEIAAVPDVKHATYVAEAEK